jgi:hypothetical protein
MAMTWFRKAADQGNATARTNVSWLDQNGWGVKQDYPEAMAWYRKAADQGNATAQVNLGWLYRKGYGVERDYAQAMAWFRKAADQDNAQARANLGWLHQKGLGVKQDYAEAMTWYRKAADQGNTDAQSDIGEFYQNGWGVKQDYSEALTWYLGAADKGNADAQNSLKKDGRVGATKIVSSSGDGRLDRGARDCAASLKTDALFPVEFKGKDLMVRIQLLYNSPMSFTPGDPRIAVGGREQFYVEMAGIASKTADWSVTGVGCTGAACGTVSPDGLYTVPDVLSQPPFVRVKGTLDGANPIAASAIVMLVEKH